jgi:biopolymer transport protein TolR
MAMTFNVSNGRRRKRAVMSEINVTPLVDVMLVLLIIFMVTSPMLITGVDVDLPKTSGAPLSGQKDPLSISIDAKGNLFIQKTKIRSRDLVPKLKTLSKGKYDTMIYVKGDKNLDYGTVMSVMGKLSAVGFKKVSLITEIQ